MNQVIPWEYPGKQWHCVASGKRHQLVDPLVPAGFKIAAPTIVGDRFEIHFAGHGQRSVPLPVPSGSIVVRPVAESIERSRPSGNTPQAETASNPQFQRSESLDPGVSSI